MTILWFFLIVSWNSEVMVRHGFPTFEACHDTQIKLARLLQPTMRTVTDCIGIPLDTSIKKQRKAA